AHSARGPRRYPAALQPPSRRSGPPRVEHHRRPPLPQAGGAAVRRLTPAAGPTSPAEPEPRIPLTEVPRLLGRRAHLNTILRWTISGVRGVRLRSELVGG